MPRPVNPKSKVDSIKGTYTILRYRKPSNFYYVHGDVWQWGEGISPKRLRWKVPTRPERFEKTFRLTANIVDLGCF